MDISPFAVVESGEENPPIISALISVPNDKNTRNPARASSMVSKMPLSGGNSF
jgi:hypothetical protein